jgi:hypothetical protein
MEPLDTGALRERWGGETLAIHPWVHLILNSRFNLLYPMTDLPSYVAIALSAVAIVIALFGYFEERKKRVLLEKMVKQMMRVARSQERQVKALQRMGGPKSADEIELEKQKLAWDKIKTVGRALGLDVDE